ncbi:MAG: hypothetical protein WCY26_02750 [Thiohalobacteraceae bacterium]
MTGDPVRLTLLVPGLFGPGTGPADGRAPGGPGLAGLPNPSGARRTALAQLLTRADRWPEPADADALRYRLCGYALPEGQDRPDAWLSYQMDVGATVPDALLRADPVHLRADRSHLVLFDGAHLQIVDAEVQALAAAFNMHYAADGMRLEFATPVRGYLHLPRQPDMRTTPLARASGHDIDASLPSGPDARDWHRFLNEVQMLFHEHPVNREREARGRPLINSLWLWGGGPPLAAEASDWQGVWCEDTVLQGLARLNGIPCADPPTDVRAWLHELVGGSHLVCLDGLRPAVAYGDVESWLAETGRLEQDWFTPLLQALRDRRLRELMLYPDDGQGYRITRGAWWRFWRRP